MNDLSPETHAFLAEQRASEGPSLDDRRRIRERLMLQLGAAAFSTGAASSTAAMTNAVPAPELPAPASTPAPVALPVAKVAGIKLSLAAKFALSAALLGGLGALAAHGFSKPAVATPAIVEPVSTAVAAPSPVVEEPAVVEVAQAPMPELPAKLARKPRARAGEAASSIAEEIALLTRAQAALRAGKASEALTLSREHATRFPAGSMRHERLGIDAMARCANGEDGATAAAEFMRAASGSPLTSAVRKACKLP